MILRLISNLTVKYKKLFFKTWRRKSMHILAFILMFIFGSIGAAMKGDY